MAAVVADSAVTQSTPTSADCPVCKVQVRITDMNAHIDWCLSRDAITAAVASEDRIPGTVVKTKHPLMDKKSTTKRKRPS